MPDISLMHLLFVAYLLLFILSFLATRMDIIHPAVIGTGILTISGFFGVEGARWWGYHLTLEGFWVLFLGLAAFVAASLWVTHEVPLVTPSRKADELPALHEISWRLSIFFSILMLVFAYINAQDMYELSLQFGNTEGYRRMISVVRLAVEQDEAVFSRWMSYRTVVAQMLAYIYLYLLLSNTIFCGWKWRYLAAVPPILCYLPFLVLSTGRMTMFYFVIYGFTVASILYLKKHDYSKKARRNILLCAVCAGATFALLFYLMGLITGKTSFSLVGRSYFHIFAHYAGTSLPAFGTVVTYPALENGYIGSHTLAPIYRVLIRLGMDFPFVKSFMPFTDFDHVETNVYTVFWRYFLDYGFIGMSLMMAILAEGYTLAYLWIRRSRLHPYAIMAYGMVVYPVFWFPMDERFFMEVFNTTTIYDLILLYLLCKLLLQHAKKTPISPPSTISLH